MGPIGMPELIVVLALVLIVFGAGKLPDVMGSMGRGVREFRKASDGQADSAAPAAPGSAAKPAAAAAPAPPAVAPESPAPVPPPDDSLPSAPVPPPDDSLPSAPALPPHIS